MTIRLALGALLLAFPAMAHAQDTDAAPALPDPDAIGETITIGAGVGITPDYVGSNDYRIIPAVAVRGSVGGISFSSRGTYLSADLLTAKAGKLEFTAGPIAGVRLNRVSKSKDAVVALLPKRKVGIELGGHAGVALKGLTNPFDSLSARVDVLRDVNGAHGSTVISPSVAFSTPLSLKTFASLSASTDIVQDGYADAYFDVTPADSLASGLPTFDANGGRTGWKVSLLAAQSITGNLLGGWQVFGLGSYGKLRGDFADSPLVSIRGSDKQLMGAIGIGYTF